MSQRPTRPSLLLLGALVLASPYLPINTANAAVPKVGTVCKKLGQSQQSDGVVVICKKSGKKLVWVIALGIRKTPFPMQSQPNS